MTSSGRGRSAVADTLCEIRPKFNQLSQIFLKHSYSIYRPRISIILIMYLKTNTYLDIVVPK